MSSFYNWLCTFIDEKGLDLSEPVAAKDGEPIQCGHVIQGMCATHPNEQAKIKSTLVAIDFRNGDVMHFVRHLAKAQTARQWELLTAQEFGGVFAY